MNKLILAALLLLPTLSYAADWLDLGKSSDKRLQLFIDLDSVKRSNVRVIGDHTDYIQAVVQITYINNHPRRKQGIYYTNHQDIISCTNETIFNKAYIAYGFKDEVIDSWNSPKSVLSSSDFKYQFPETTGSAAVVAVCNAFNAK